MSEYITPGDYAAQTEKWRTALGIPVSPQYTDQVEIANEMIEELSMNDPEQYETLLQEANAWAAREGRRLEEYAPNVQLARTIGEQLTDIPTGTYLMLHGHFGNSINSTIEQGKLTKVDLANNKVDLYSTTYDKNFSVSIDKIEYIDASRSGSGALGSVQQADLRRVGNDWYRGDKKL